MYIKRENYWMCIIGPVDTDKLPDGADYPPRRAAIEAMVKMLGEDNVKNCWSGWGMNRAIKEEVMEAWNKRR